MKNERLGNEARSEHILNAAKKLCHEIGFAKITRNAVAELAGTANGNVNRVFGSFDELKRQVMEQAVRDEDHIIVAQGIAIGDEIAKSADANLKEAALKHIIAG